MTDCPHWRQAEYEARRAERQAAAARAGVVVKGPEPAPVSTIDGLLIGLVLGMLIG